MLAALLLTGIIILLIDTGSPLVNNPVCGRLVDNYGLLVSSRVPITIVHNPGLRPGVLSLAETSLIQRESCHIMSSQELLGQPEPVSGQVKIAVITPGAVGGYDGLAAGVLRHQARVVVQCSGMDTWHTTARGYESLVRLRQRCLRVVVFDGGHHLPTLGLAPDIIIVPSTAGYAAHSYMSDAIEVKRLIQLSEKIDCPAVLVTVPRWALVKSEASLGRIVERTVKQILTDGSSPGTGLDKIGSAVPRASKVNRTVFCYVEDGDTEPLELVLNRLAALGPGDVDQIYLAFNYRSISMNKAIGAVRQLQIMTGKPVDIVNRPLKVSGVIIHRFISDY